MQMPGRVANAKDYRYGFQGQEKDDEIKGEGNSYDFGARMLDVRLGRWLAIDPLAAKYPSFSPYCFVANSPILFIDPDGKKIVVHYKDENGKSKKIVLKNKTDIELLKNHSSQFVKDMYETLSYLKNEQPIQDAIGTKKRLHVYEREENDPVAFYQDEDGKFKIDYDPYEALELVDDENAKKSPGDRYGTGEIQTPALGFLHEVGHFLGRIKNGRKKHQALRDTEDDQYHNKEEKRVIEKIENPAADRLKEPKRTNHSGIPRISKGPTSTEVEPRKKGSSVRDL